MTKIILTAAILLGLTMTPANAYKTFWECMGGELACGTPTREATAAKPSRATPRRTTSGSRSARSGMASYYWQGQRTASGARFNPDGLTAAHRTLPFGTRVRVTNKRNGQSVVVTINDRGPFVGGRVIDLSRGAARVINMTGAGVVPVSIDVQ